MMKTRKKTEMPKLPKNESKNEVDPFLAVFGPILTAVASEMMQTEQRKTSAAELQAKALDRASRVFALIALHADDRHFTTEDANVLRSLANGGG